MSVDSFSFIICFTLKVLDRQAKQGVLQKENYKFLNDILEIALGF